MIRIVLTSVVLFFVSQSFASGKFCFILRKKGYVLYNFLSIFCLYTFLNIFIYDQRISFLIVISFVYVLSLLMYYIHEFRGTNVNFSDILSINTAKEVAGGYKYSIKPIFVFIALIVILEFYIQILSIRKYPIDRIKEDSIFIYSFFWSEIGKILLFAISFFLLKDKISDRKFDYSLFAGINEGYIYNFLSSISIFHKKNNSKKSKEIANEFVNYLNDNFTKNSYNYSIIKNSENNAHIIVIMNESFGSVHNRIKTNISVTPYYDSLKGLTKGNLYVNTFGGGTANTEFEFLTCMTIGNYQYPVMPYNNFVNCDKYSIARLFNNLGYDTVAMHPYTATNYHRDIVYKRFGFKELLFFNDFKNKAYVRNYVSDESMYKEVIRQFEHKKKINKKIFLFGITMQNHSGYNSFDGAKVKSYISDVDKTSLDSYLSLMKISDDALKVLIDYFKKEKDRVIILFFGDHNASFGNTINEKIYDSSINYECTNSYMTPFFIFDNKNSENRYIDSISANFLSLELLKTAGLPYDTIHILLSSIYKDYNTYSFHKKKSNHEGKLYDITSDIYMELEQEYLNE